MKAGELKRIAVSSRHIQCALQTCIATVKLSHERCGKECILRASAFGRHLKAKWLYPGVCISGPEKVRWAIAAIVLTLKSDILES